jgi:hypothetical protein
MGGHHQGGLLFGPERDQQIDDLLAGVGIQVAGRFVGEDQIRFVD